MQTSDCSPLNKRKPSSTNAVQPSAATKAKAKGKGKARDPDNDQAIGKRSCKRKVQGSSACLCLNLKTPMASSLRSPTRMTLRQLHWDCPPPLWGAKTHRTKETEVVEPNDHLSMRFIHQPGLSAQMRVPLRRSLSRGPNQPMKLILMQTLVALATITHHPCIHDLMC